MKHQRKAILLGFVLGIVGFVGYRVFLAPGEIATHHHANFAVFINGERLDLSDDRYMEDVEGCKPDYLPLQPEERVHMHNHEDTVVHVHDDGVTWGHFFANLGFALSDFAFISDDGIIYAKQGNRALTFVLNGKPVDSIANRLIGSEDRLLISYGTESLEDLLKTQFETVEHSAAYHNDHPDPGSCSGEIDTGFWVKVRQAIWR